MKEKKTIISIIVPVYNVEKYLVKCLDSLVNQTMEDIEIICVNDGSTDNSQTILENYQQKDNRIVVIQQANQGVSEARNNGLKCASGQYIMFVDGDDWIDENTCDIAYHTAQEYKAQLVLWPYVREFQSVSKKKQIFAEDVIIYNQKDVEEKLQRRMCGLYGEELRHPENADALVPVWGKLYKHSIIKEENRFVDLKEIGTLEDGLFNLEVLGNVKKAVYIQRYLYHYRKDNVGSETSGYRKSLFVQWNHLYKRMALYNKKHNKSCQFQQALENRIALGILGLGLNEFASGKHTFAKIKCIKQILSDKDYQKAYRDLELKYFPIHWKLFYGFAKYRMATGVYILLSFIQRIITR